MVPAFTGLGAPHWDGRARGTIVGMTRGTGKEHIVRATLESIAYQTRDIAEAMEADSGVETTTLRVDGGAVKNNFLCQLQANILQRKIARPAVDETTALGPAYAAGLAVGHWSDAEELRSNSRIDRQLTAPMGADGADRPIRLVLVADGEVHAAFDDYTALACPTAEAFPYTYRRGADKRVHVRNRNDREVGVYPSIRAMKADAYRPVPDPLVPEVHLDDTPLRTAWLLAVDDGSVRFGR